MSATQYGLYFNKEGVTIRIPINPQEYTIKYPSDNTRYNVLGLGEIIIPRLPKLQQISWESYFPGAENDTLALISGGFKPPEFYIDTFKKYQASEEPVRFIANRVMEDGEAIFDTNIQVIVEDFEASEKGGETGDFYYRISLSNYRDYTPQKVTIRPVENNTVSATATEQRKVPNDVITVGDTVIANGRYWYTSYGESPFGNANNTTTTVTRIVQSPKSGQSYPVCIGNLGWLQMSQLKKG